MKLKSKPAPSSPPPPAPTYYETSDLYIGGMDVNALANFVKQIEWGLRDHGFDVNLRLLNIPSRLTNPDGDVVYARLVTGKKTYWDACAKGLVKPLTCLHAPIKCPSWE